MTHGSLFSGIGGFDLAAEWMGWTNMFHCEIEPFPQKILKHYWPDAELFTDIKTADFSAYANRIDVLSGGFPCQPYSMAGKRLGKEDDRHLWPEMLRAIREIKPRWVVGENVSGLISWNGGLVFDEVQADLETAGYEVIPFILPACGVNAPHRRDRVWFVSNSQRTGLEGAVWSSGAEGFKHGFEKDDAANTDSGQRPKRRVYEKGRETTERYFGSRNTRINGWETWENFPTQPPVCGRDDGFSSQLDGITFPKWRNESIKGYGNAVVPQVVLQIFKAIEQYESNNQQHF